VPRIPPEQRFLVLLTAGLAVAAGLLVAFVVLDSSGGDRPREYQAFEVGSGPALAEQARRQPLFFADPIGGERGFVLVLHEGSFVALHVVPPAGSADCPIDWDPEEEAFEDCEGTRYQPDQLDRFPVRVGDDDDPDAVFVDLRTLNPAPRPQDGDRRA
jgi:hypothetical protein